MTDSRAAVGLDRLPWLADEPKPRATRGVWGLAGWIVAAVLLIAGASYWLGMRSVDRNDAAERQAAPTTTIPLPKPRQAEPPQVRAEPVPDVEPVVAPPIPIVEDSPAPKARRVERTPAKPLVSKPSASETETTQAEEAAPAKIDPTRPWPVRVKDGASGRLVRVGAFSTARQAKKGWWAIMKVNPALKRLPALVVPVQSLRNGRVYYRLQMGTTSQAHSEVLCQRMRIIGQSCVVIEVSNRGQDEVAL